MLMKGFHKGLIEYKFFEINIHNKHCHVASTLTYSSTDYFAPPVPVYDWLILYCRNFILHQQYINK